MVEGRGKMGRRMICPSAVALPPCSEVPSGSTATRGDLRHGVDLPAQKVVDDIGVCLK